MDTLATFHPVVRSWFEGRFPDGPTEPQAAGWPAIARGRDTLIAAPTGSGKTLAAFLVGIDRLIRAAEREGELADETRVVYVSPLKALATDIHHNLEIPLAEIRAVGRELGVELPEIRSLVRTGDTPASARVSMLRRPPHLLITTPESLYLMVTAGKSRETLRAVRTVIVDEIHAVARDKRGAHLAVTLERLAALCQRAPARIGLSATQRPIEVIARLLVGGAPGGPPGASCTVVDFGHRRDMDISLEVPGSELGPVAPHEQWGEILDAVASQVEKHRTTLVFVNTRRAAERVAHLLAERLGEDQVAAHHGSLSKKRRLTLEERLRAGELRALVATASLELGIDIGPVELVCQVGSPRSFATFLQRVGRSGHSRGATPKGLLYPTTRDELLECAALLRGVRQGRLDRLEPPLAPLDILAQQIVAACSAERWKESDLYALVCRSAPFASLAREDFDAVVELLSEGVRHGARPPRRLPAPRPGERSPARPPRIALGRPHLGRSHSRDRRLPGAGRSRRHLRGNGERGLRRRERGRRRVPAREHVLADPPRRGRRGARDRCAGCAALDSLLAGRGAGPNRGALRRGLRPARRPGRLSRRGGPAGRRCLAHPRARPRLRLRRAGRALPGGGARCARPDSDPARHRLRAFLRRDRGNAAGRPRPSRRPHQPRPRAGAPEALLPQLRLRAPGGGQRRRGGSLARPSAQLPPGRRASLPLSENHPRDAHPGGSHFPDVRSALALEPGQSPAGAPSARRAPESSADPAHGGRRFHGGTVSEARRLSGERHRTGRDPGSPPGPPDPPRLPPRGDGPRRPAHASRGDGGRRGAGAPPGHHRAVAVRPRDPERAALHLPGRCAPRGAAQPGRGHAPRPARERSRPRPARSRRHRAGSRRGAARAARSRRASRPAARLGGAAARRRMGGLPRAPRRRGARRRGRRRQPVPSGSQPSGGPWSRRSSQAPRSSPTSRCPRSSRSERHPTPARPQRRSCAVTSTAPVRSPHPSWPSAPDSVPRPSRSPSRAWKRRASPCAASSKRGSRRMERRPRSSARAGCCPASITTHRSVYAARSSRSALATSYASCCAGSTWRRAPSGRGARGCSRWWSSCRGSSWRRGRGSEAFCPPGWRPTGASGSTSSASRERWPGRASHRPFRATLNRLARRAAEEVRSLPVPLRSA